MPTKRRVRSARPIEDHTKGFKGHVKRFFLSFTPSRFRGYWLNKQGAIRLAKLGGLGVLFIFLVFLWYAKDLPSPSKINARVSAQTTKFYDRTGKTLLYEVYGNQNRSIISFDEMPDNMKHATIAIEDRNFYKEGAFSFIGYLRAAVSDVLTHSTSQGGSTLTQQYVKNALLDPTDHSFSRKIKELILSLEIGQFYSKNDVLKLYLNEIPFGSSAYGLESACKTYFPQDNPDPNDSSSHCAPHLTLSQSALLASILNAPTYYSPYGANQQALVDRQHLDLDLMAQQGYISQSDADGAKWTVDQMKAAVPATQNLYANIKAPHFVLYTEQVLEEKYGVNAVTEGGLNVITTLDMTKQQEAEDAITNSMSAIRADKGSNAALVSADPKTGQVLAMVGSYNFSDPDFGAFDVATADRQPGSSFKPFVYATAWAEKNGPLYYGPGTTMYDVKTDFGGGYIPKNYDGSFHGIQTMRTALDGSLNIPAVKTLAIAGIQNSINTAHKMGITTLNDPNAASDYGLSLVLGSGDVKLYDMVNAYESFANGGKHYTPTTILKVTDQKGKVLEDNTKPKTPTQALDPQIAYLMANTLADRAAGKYVFGSDLDVPGYAENKLGIKTGTTQYYADAWTMGFSPNLTTGVWVGNNDNKSMTTEAADIAAPVFVKYMSKALKDYPADSFKAPAGIKTVTLDKKTGRLPTNATTQTTTDIFPSWYKPATSANGQNATIDTVSGKLATSCTPDLAKKTVYSGAITPEIAPTINNTQYQLWMTALVNAGYATGGGDIPTASDDVHSCDDTKPVVSLHPLHGGGPTYNFTADVTLGTFGTNKPGVGTATLQIYLDDQIVSTQNISASGTYNGTFNATSTGSHNVKAVVTDTGYYQGTDEQTINVTSTSGSGNGGSSSFRGVTPADGSTVNAGTNVTFTWGPDSGASTYTLWVDGSARGSSTGGFSTTLKVNTPGAHSWYVVADNGDQTNTLNFTAQ